MPRTLHLIKHGRPRIIPGVPAHDWVLAEGALDGLDALVARLTPRPDVIVSSEEPKARATADGLAARLGVPWRAMLGLHEQLRYTAPFHTDPANFEADLRQFFDHPHDVVYGEESAADACTRFGNAVQAVLRANPHGTVAIVSHGTVISLLLAHANRLDPWPLWRSLGLLDAVTVDVPGLRVREPTT
ncbi:broad specificity phosphatase PhoE [Deinococcus metalli]|uniref:Broad specificity phosphatase PhoE n=1 Tax=Deinococcus metalli TaxID=1141878 RepID=A0A7W8NRP1_9DEIO|nr:histidine phosphatase family protein [Deinococcus metalli]MBB5377103.1 broad specificity phosphatase PhoE [Deinococcus metalli]GHF48980.1 phosphoglycerate mutase [Deinococcus metalli]